MADVTHSMQPSSISATVVNDHLRMHALTIDDLDLPVPKCSRGAGFV